MPVAFETFDRLFLKLIITLDHLPALHSWSCGYSKQAVRSVSPTMARSPVTLPLPATIRDRHTKSSATLSLLLEQDMRGVYDSSKACSI